MILPANSDEWFQLKAGLPHPCWPVVHGWSRGENLQDDERFWSDFVRSWLARLSEALGGNYSIAESANFFLLSTQSDSGRAATLAYLEKIRAGILYSLGERIVPKGTVGKNLVLRFASDLDYYRYVSAEDREGESATSGGMFLRKGYSHIATYEQPMPDSIRWVLVHELAHNLTCHLPLPFWLDEALAMQFEIDLAGGTGGRNPEKAREHKQYWSETTIQEFWTGASFLTVEGQGPSYDLALGLFQTIRRELDPPPAALQQFVLAADWSDAGEWAARKYLNASLQEITREALGPGSWAPKPENWASQPPAAKAEEEAAGEPDENGFVWPKGMEPED
jgi:hypothetical protein